MDSKESFKVEANKKINEMLVHIIDDLPSNFQKNIKDNYLIISENETKIEYKKFYKSIREIILIFQDTQKSSVGALVKHFPRAIKNIKIIKLNKEIITLQQKFLEKYFSQSNNVSNQQMNVKNKIIELKENINCVFDDSELNDEEKYEILDKILKDFDERIRMTLVNDLFTLSNLMEKEKKL